MVKIITERLASLSFKFAKKEGIYLYPADIIYKDKVLKDNDDEKATQFLKKLQNIDEIPSTSVPPLAEIEKAFLEATKETDKAIYVSASSELSSIIDAGRTVAKKLKSKGKDIKVFDSGTVVSMEGMYAYQANKLARQGKDIDEIMSILKDWRDNRRVVEYGVIETLKFLEKNGRIGKAKSMLANLFSFKPLITAQNKVLEPIGKVRTNSQGIDKVIELIRSDIERLNAKGVEVMYDFGLSDDFVKNTLHPEIEKNFSIDKMISFNQISTTIACHLGPNLWGVCVFVK